MGPLGRRVPTDWRHYERFPLTASTVPSKPVPVVIGVNWHEAFDRPEKDNKGRWWIGRGDLGRIRGGHAVCLEPGDPMSGPRTQDTRYYWRFYDQGAEGACVGFAASRMCSLSNRRQYFARWLWDRAKEVDDWAETNPGDDNGTSVRAAMDILRTRGHVVWKSRYADMDVAARAQLQARPEEGISANRWARTVDEVHAALQSPATDRIGAVRLLNSWGHDGYPQRVWLPDDVLQRLIDEDGEVSLITDR